jgi:hypothetical protein
VDRNEATGNVVRSPCMQKIQYAKSEGASLKFVDCLIDETGLEQFSDRNDGAFVPSDEEREMARQLLQEAARREGAERITIVGRRIMIDWIR